MISSAKLFLASLAVLWSAAASKAHAEIVLSQVIVDLQPERADYQDIEIWNAGGERAFVQVEPSEIVRPGQPEEQRVPITDPEQGGLLVSPQRLVLEAGERRVIRFAAIVPRSDRERIYRVAVRPVEAPEAMEATGIKVLLGYDLLALFRPVRLEGEVTTVRRGDRVEFTNNSNFAHEIYDGKQCSPKGDACAALPATRLYPGATWNMTLPYSTQAEIMMTAGTTPVRKTL